MPQRTYEVNPFTRKIDITYRGAVEALEGTNVRITVFEEIAATTGTVTKAVGSTIVLDQYSEDSDAVCLVLDTSGQKPKNISPTEADGTEIFVSAFDIAGAYTISGTPFDHENGIPFSQWAIAYYIDIPFINYRITLDRDTILKHHKPKDQVTSSQVLPAYGSVVKDPVGFPRTWQADTIITFTNGTRTFSIQPTGTAFNYYINGIEYTPAGDTVIIDDTAGLWFIYYDGATLTAAQNVSSRDFFKIFSAVSLVYWDKANQEALIVATEQHGINMASDTHYHLHETYGLQYETGLEVSGHTLDTASDAALRFDVSSGECHDEDISVIVVDDDTPDSYWGQILSNISAPVLYKSGASGFWVQQAASTLPYLVVNGGERLAYNQFTGGAWQLTQLGNNRFVNYFLVAINDKDNPIKMVAGEVEYTTKNSAIDAARDELVALGSLIGLEVTYLYTFTLHTNTGFSGTYKAKIVNLLDLRGVVGSPGGSAQAGGDHNALVNKEYDASGHMGFAREPEEQTFDSGDFTLVTDQYEGTFTHGLNRKYVNTKFFNENGLSYEGFYEPLSTTQFKVFMYAAPTGTHTMSIN